MKGNGLFAWGGWIACAALLVVLVANLPDKSRFLYVKSDLKFDESETASVLIQKKLRPDDKPGEWVRVKY